MGQNVSISQTVRQKELIRASLKGRLADAKTAIDNGADPTLKDKFGWAPIHHVCTEGHLDILRFFVGRARRRSRRLTNDNEPRDPQRQSLVVNMLKLRNDEGATPLHLAVTSGKPEMVEYIVHQLEANEQTAFIDDQQQEGLTALHLAAVMKSPPIVLLLRSHGASTAVKDDKGRTPFDMTDDSSTRAALRRAISFTTRVARGANSLRYNSCSSNFSDNEHDDEAVLSGSSLASSLRSSFERSSPLLTLINNGEINNVCECGSTKSAEIDSLRSTPTLTNDGATDTMENTSNVNENDSRPMSPRPAPMTLEQVELIFTQLEKTFSTIEDLNVLDDVIEYYASQLAELRKRRLRLQKAQEDTDRFLQASDGVLRVSGSGVALVFHEKATSESMSSSESESKDTIAPQLFLS